jgi:Fic family protein
MNYIYQLKGWPNFKWKTNEFLALLSEARNLQGRLYGKMDSLGFEFRNEAFLDTVTLDVLKSSEIEGELLDPAQVRSSIARKLGMELAATVKTDRNVEGVVEMMLDATQKYFEPLSADRLFDWHAALFPTGRSGIRKITTANWRQDINGPMQVVSGSLGREKIHYQAPDANQVEKEMTKFINWFNHNEDNDLVMKAAIAHLWFITIHPFEDGNGRIARAITDVMLAKSDKSTQRFYSMSAQIRVERNNYYEILEKTQKGGLDITEWLIWFLNCLINALKSTEEVLSNILLKADFWKEHSGKILNDRQQKILNKIWDGFEGKLTSAKWAKIAKCSKDSAVRDINDLIDKNILEKEESGGRSTSYRLKIS